ncbi:MAG TPA: methylated-DNA--[protein]-cysteine S-methyltransferase [Burkholderiales bacterium]|jgi:methylated-DNA-[protein]-cysteine S-methyltransferase|nr:methylated-DNA--[protein]-cysteine S-methyltransferase [Burkholderiales bacterium]
MDEYCAVIEFPAMRVGIRTRDEALEGIRYLPRSVPLSDPSSRFAERVVRQLQRYRDDPDASFDLPLAIEGTTFQRRVWRALGRIPRGETRTYGQVATALGSAARAVGQACGENRLPIVIPCHRVVAAGGIGGFGHARGGYLLETKRWLLGHERAL